MDFVYLMLNDKGQTESVQLLNSSGVAQPLDANDPLVARLNTGPGSGRPIRIRNEHGEFVEAMQLTEFHYFVDENNKVIPIPPGSIVEGEFEDEEEEANGVTHELQENDQFISEAGQVPFEMAKVGEENETPSAETEVPFEESIHCDVSGIDEEHMAVPMLTESNAADVMETGEELGSQELQEMATVDETGELALQNVSDSIFTQDEIELEEEVVSLQISEPEFVPQRLSIKHSKRSSTYAGYTDSTSIIAKDTLKTSDSVTVGENQVKSPSRKTKRKQLSLVGVSSELQVGTLEKLSIQPSRKNLPPFAESNASPNASDSSYSDTGRPKRSVLRRSALEMLHGEGKAPRKHTTSSGSDSELEVPSSVQPSGKRRHSKGPERFLKSSAASADKQITKAASQLSQSTNEVLSDLAVNSNSGLLLAGDVQQNAIAVDLSPGVNPALSPKVQLPVSSLKRGKGRPRKVTPETPHVLDTQETPSKEPRDVAAAAACPPVSVCFEPQQLIATSASDELAKTEIVASSAEHAISTGLELPIYSDISAKTCSSIEAGVSSFADALELAGMTLGKEPEKIDSTDLSGKCKSSIKKPAKRGRGRFKSSSERKLSIHESQTRTKGVSSLSSEKHEANCQTVRENEEDMDFIITDENSFQLPTREISGLAENIESSLIAEEPRCDEVPQETHIEEEKAQMNLTDSEIKGLCEIDGAVYPVCEDVSSVLEECENEFSLNDECKIHASLQDQYEVASQVIEECSNDNYLNKELFTDTSMKHDGGANENIKDKDLHSSQDKWSDQLAAETKVENSVSDEVREVEINTAKLIMGSEEEQYSNILLQNVVSSSENSRFGAVPSSSIHLDSDNLKGNEWEALMKCQIESSEELDKTLPSDKEEVVLEDEENPITSSCFVDIEKVSDSETKPEGTDEHNTSYTDSQAILDLNIQDEEDFHEFQRDMFLDMETASDHGAVVVGSDLELERETEEKCDDSFPAKQELKLQLRVLENSVKQGSRTEVQTTCATIEEKFQQLDNKASLLFLAELEHLVTEIRSKLTQQEPSIIAQKTVTSQSWETRERAAEGRLRRIVGADLMKLRALDRELDERYSQLMVARGQLSRKESQVRQKEQMLERRQMLLELEKEALEEDQKKLVKAKESLRKERKLCAKLKESKKRSSAAETPSSAPGRKKARTSDTVHSSSVAKERRTLFEEMTAIKETKTIALSKSPLPLIDNDTAAVSQSTALSRQASIESSSKEITTIDEQQMQAENFAGHSIAKVDMQSKGKQVAQGELHAAASVVKGKKELLRRFEADELNSPSEKSSKISQKPAKLETSLCSTSSSSVGKKSSNSSSKYAKSPSTTGPSTVSSSERSTSTNLTKDVNSKKSSITSGLKSRRRDSPLSMHTKKIHLDNVNKQDLINPPCKKLEQDNSKRVASPSEGSLKKREYKRPKYSSDVPKL